MSNPRDDALTVLQNTLEAVAAYAFDEKECATSGDEHCRQLMGNPKRDDTRPIERLRKEVVRLVRPARRAARQVRTAVLPPRGRSSPRSASDQNRQQRRLGDGVCRLRAALAVRSRLSDYPRHVGAADDATLGHVNASRSLRAEGVPGYQQGRLACSQTLLIAAVLGGLSCFPYRSLASGSVNQNVEPLPTVLSRPTCPL